MNTARADDGEALLHDDVIALLRDAGAKLGAIATTGHDDIDEDLCAAEQAIRRALAKWKRADSKTKGD